MYKILKLVYVIITFLYVAVYLVAADTLMQMGIKYFIIASIVNITLIYWCFKILKQ